MDKLDLAELGLQDPEEWMKRLFSDEYCCECGGDAEHHDAVLVMGNWFAQCIYPPDDDGNRHPIIAEFRKNADGQ